MFLLMFSILLSQQMGKLKDAMLIQYTNESVLIVTIQEPFTSQLSLPHTYHWQEDPTLIQVTTSDTSAMHNCRRDGEGYWPNHYHKKLSHSQWPKQLLP